MENVKRGLVLLCIGALLFANMPVYATTGEEELALEEVVEKAVPVADKGIQVVKIEEKVLPVSKEVRTKPRMGETIADIFPDSKLAVVVATKLSKSVDDMVNDTELQSIKELDVWFAGITKLTGIGRLTGLEVLNLTGNALESIPCEISALIKLEELDLSQTQLTEIPKEIGALVNLESLILLKNKLKDLPSEVTNLKNLTYLDLMLNQLESVPDAIMKLTRLEYLDLSSNQLTSISEVNYSFIKSIGEFDLQRQKFNGTIEKVGYTNETYEFQGLPVYAQLLNHGALLNYELINSSAEPITEGIVIDASGKIRISKETIKAEGTYKLQVSIKDGEFKNSIYVQSFTITNRVVVTDIIGVLTSGKVGTPLILEGTVLPEDASSQEIIWTIEEAGKTEAVLEGSELFSNESGIVKVKATITDGLGQGSPFEKFFEIEIAGGKQSLAYQANPDGNKVQGLKSSYKENETITFTAIGDGRVSGVLTIGDERYTPINWSINPNGTWIQSPYDAKTSISKAGNYQLQITYQKEMYDGIKWTADSTTDVKSTKVVVEKEQAIGETKVVKTGDVLNSFILFLLAGSILVVFVQIKKRKKV